jgi:hypothetical protein
MWLQALGQQKSAVFSKDNKVNGRPPAENAGQGCPPSWPVKNGFLTKAA